ncbi:MAG: PfkB family carbohydrate kinase [Brumimicrobium sp.]
MTPQELFQDFKKRKVLVLGDVMVDAYLEGNVNRISPEAPVPIVSFTAREERLGGAANVALNLISLGAEVSMCSVIGDDENAKKMLRLMDKRNIASNGVVNSKTRITTVKTRVIGNHQQLLRVDEEQTNDISSKEEDLLIESVEDILKEGCDAIIFEDYNKGVLTEKVITEVIALSKEYDVPTSVDPKLKNFLAYKGVTLFKPNLKELKEGLNRTFDIADRSMFEGAVDELSSLINAEMLFVTMSEHGVFMQTKASKDYIPAHVRNIADVSGAGDTVISVATLCLAAGISPKSIAEIANLAGGIVCEKRGVVAIDSDQLLNEVEKHNIQC